ncbi:hypothetical protein DICPUDRAFT_5958, partial [Dictyostelium purpureum]
KLILFLIAIIFIVKCKASSNLVSDINNDGGGGNGGVNIFNSNNMTMIYDEKLSDSFTIPIEYSDKVFTQVKSPTHSGNFSIAFTTDFYIFSKANQYQNITLNKQVFKCLKLWVYPSTPQQDLTISLINGDKEVHALPIINQINPINSFSRSSYLPPNKWSEISIDLEYFPSIDYKAIWFLQRHPNSSIFLDDIGLKRADTQRNRRILYKGGIQGYGVIIHEDKGIKLYQNVKTYKKSPFSIVFNMKKSRTFSIDFQNRFEVRNATLDLVFHINLKKKLPTNGDIMVSFIPIHPLDFTPKFLLSGSKKAPCEYVTLPNDKWIKCTVRVPQQIEFRKIQFSFSNPNITTSYHVFLDNFYLQQPTIQSLLSINNPDQSNNLLDFFQNSARAVNKEIISDTLIASNLKRNDKIEQIKKDIINKKVEKELKNIQNNNNSNSNPEIIVNKKNNILESIENKNNSQIKTSIINKQQVLGQTYFSFEGINPTFVTTIGQKLAWGQGLPDITFRCPNPRAIIKSQTLYYGDDFDKDDFVSIVGKDPLKILTFGGVNRNEFKFLNLNFNSPFNDFYLLVSIDQYEEVWISASKPDGTVTNNWKVIKDGYLTSKGNYYSRKRTLIFDQEAFQSPSNLNNNKKEVNNKNSNKVSPSIISPTPYTPFLKEDNQNINEAILDSVNNNLPIKTKIKGDQGFYLKAAKTSDINPPMNYIILKQHDLISGISFSMVSDRTTSSFFYALLARPNNEN